MNDLLLRAEHLCKTYKNQIQAVRNVTVEFETGGFYMIKGRSGSGKTTLMHLLSLLDTPDSGSLYLNGREVYGLSDREKSAIRSKTFGFVFQSYYLNAKLKAFENVMLPMYVNKSVSHPQMKARAAELLQTVGLTERVNHYPSELSGGEQQRVALARALANDPDCIFADEPTGNLDSRSERQILDLLKEQTQNRKTVVVVSHNDIVEEYADRVFLMNDGVLTV